MKVEQLNNVQIDWTKPQVVVHSESGNKVVVVTNHKPFNEECFSGVEISTGRLHENLYKNLYTSENATQYPIELKLTIESESELCNLYLRAGLISNEVNQIYPNDVKHEANDSDCTLFSMLDNLVSERNLYKND